MIQSIHNDPIPQEIDPKSGLPIGPRVENARPARTPDRIVLKGRYTRLEPLGPATHLEDLYDASTPKDRVVRFRYLPDPPPDSLGSFNAWLTRAAASADPPLLRRDRSLPSCGERVQHYRAVQDVTIAAKDTDEE